MRNLIGMVFFPLVIYFIENSSADSTDQTGFAVDYLKSYGYMEESSEGYLQEVSAALEEFQRFSHLEVTGVLDNATLEIMNLPRCALPDVLITTNDISPLKERRKRFVATLGWDHTHITYDIVRYTNDLPGEVVDDAADRAFKVWELDTILTFERRRDGFADIFISFYPSYEYHGDDFIFDGPGKYLAHAFYPWVQKNPGDIHLDDAEQWTVKSKDGENLWNVLVHEIGHSLGLDHTNIATAVMYPFHFGYKPDLRLHPDDIAGIEHLYGNGLTTLPNTATPEPQGANNPNVPNLCAEAMDAIAVDEMNLIVFKGSYHWIFREMGLTPGYPKLISQAWPGLQSNLQSAILRKSSFIDTGTIGNLLFYKDRTVWSYNGGELEITYPQDIKLLYDSPRSNLQTTRAVVELDINGETYFFTSDKQVYIHNWLQITQGPFLVSDVFVGVSGEIVSAFQGQDDYLYLFERTGIFYKVDPELLQTVNGYPRSWFSPEAGHEDFFSCSTTLADSSGTHILPCTHLLILLGCFIPFLRCIRIFWNL